MQAWSKAVATGVVGWVVMAAGVVLVFVGIVGLFTDAAASPTASAVLAGATLVAVGAAMTRDDGVTPGPAGSIWIALADTTRARAEVVATDLPEHLRPLCVDLACGAAASRYIELARILERRLAAGRSAGGDGPVEAIASAVREIANASAKEASDAVAALNRPVVTSPGSATTDVFDAVPGDEDDTSA